MPHSPPDSYLEIFSKCRCITFCRDFSLEKRKDLQNNTRDSLIAGKHESPRVSSALRECDVTYKEESPGRHLAPRGFFLLSLIFRSSHFLIKLQDEKIPIDNFLGIFGFPYLFDLPEELKSPPLAYQCVHRASRLNGHTNLSLAHPRKDL